MTRLAAALLCIATGASAQERVTFYGGLGVASVAPSGDGYAVSLTNPECFSPWSDGIDVYALEIDGLRIVVQHMSSQGEGNPDDMVVLPPAGFVADPARLTVEEHDTGVINLIPMGLS